MKTCIDLFAGLGGNSLGASQAGLNVAWAGNHWPLAVQVHSENHPGTAHACQDLQQMNWAQVPGHDVCIASPECQGFSRAKGSNRRETDTQRATAWAVISCVEYHQPKHVVVENVPEFLKWWLYPVWKQALKTMGYHVTENILNASAFGVPQNRVRVFIVASKVKPVHIDKPSGKLIPATSIVDLSAGLWKPLGNYGQLVQRQIPEARKRYGRMFLVAYYGSEKFGRDPRKPIGTITTKDRFLVVNGDRARFLSIDEARLAMGFPGDYLLPKQRTHAMKLLGNAVPPAMTREVITQLRKVA